MSSATVGFLPQSNFITAPTQIPGLLGWYDGLDPLATGVTPINGFSVSNWIDKSGQGINAINIGGSVPSYSNNAVYFNGEAANRLFFTNPDVLVANKAFTIFVVEKRQSSGNSIYFLGGSNQSPRTNLHVGYRFQNTLTFAFYSDDINLTVPNYTTNVIEPYRVWTFNLNSTFRGDVFLNGALQGTRQYSGFLTSYIGGAIGGSTVLGANYTGFLQELLFFSNALTTTQQQQVEGYLNWKWGLFDNLVQGHPYKNASNNPGYAAAFPAISQGLIAPFTTAIVSSPVEVPGLQLWLDGADTSTLSLSNTSNIVQWRDKSGNSNTFTPTSGAPTYNIVERAASFISRNSSNSDVMTSSSNITFRVGSNTLFVVAQIPTNPFGLWQYIFNVGGASSDNSFRTNFNSPPNIYPNQSIAGTGNLLYFTGLPILNTGLDTPFYLATNRFIINSVYGSGTGNTTTQVTLSSLFLNRSLTGFIYEVLIYSNALTAIQREQVEGYLAWKWGIQGNLPITHYQQNSNITGIVAPIPIVPSTRSFGFQPTSLSGLVVWLDAADAATVLNPGTSNMVWVDKSGTGRNAIVSPSNASLNFFGTFPTYCNAGNIPASIQFNSNIMYNRSSLPVAQNTFFIVLQNILPFRGGQPIFTTASSFQQPFNSVDAFQLGIVLFGGATITPNLLYGALQGTPCNINLLTQSVPNPSTNQYPFSIISITNTANASVNTFTNGITGPSVVASATRSNTGLGYAICGEWVIQNINIASTNMGTFNISEIILYSNVLTAQQRENVEGYLAYKWGLSRSLPFTHQNAFMPPS